MSLNKKYTWGDFLKEHPEHGGKKTKRTSKEGEKAFQTAFKSHAKEYLKTRQAKIEKEEKRAEAKRKDLAAKLKASKTTTAANALELRLGAMSAYIARLDKMRDRAKLLQKSL